MANLERFDKVPKGKFKGQVVDDLLNESSHNIMELIREGYDMAPDVLARANITKTIRDVKFHNEVISRPKKTNEGILKKDTKRQVEKVIEELNNQEALSEL
jgi:hypothetical protein